MDRRRFVLACGAGLLAGRSEAAVLSDDSIHDILYRRIDVEKRATGMAVAVADQGRERIVVHGVQDAPGSPPVAASTLFEIGSVTKVFTALLLADMAHRGELGFDDPVDRYLPDGLRTPQRNGRAITLAQLAIHTSGLPYFPFSPITTPNPLEALAHFSLADLRDWLAGLTLPRDPGSQWEYSNAGYGILGLALASRAGTSFDALLEKRIAAPLGLRDTTLHPSGDATKRLAKGHDAKLEAVPPIELGIFAPAGALRSTATDLLAFLRALLPDSGSPLAASARLLPTIRTAVPTLGGEQAMGWEIASQGGPFLVKDGVTSGQTASVVLDVPNRTGIAVLSNAFPSNLQLPPGGGIGAADLSRHLIRPELPLGRP